MNEISPQELNDLFVNTLEKATIKLLSQEDQEIEYQLFEEFDIGAISYLHIESLERLQVAGLIDEEIKNLSLELRKRVLQLLNGKKIRDTKTVRTDADWHKALELSDKIKDLKLIFDNGKRNKVV